SADASGTHTTRIASDHAAAVHTGCCIDQAALAADGLGLPHSTRQAAVTALTGFQSAMVRSQSGMPRVGTSALEMNDSGNSTRKPKLCAVPPPFAHRPTQPASHDSAYEKRSATPNPASAAPTPVEGRQPTTKPVPATITLQSTAVSRSV